MPLSTDRTTVTAALDGSAYCATRSTIVVVVVASRHVVNGGGDAGDAAAAIASIRLLKASCVGALPSALPSTDGNR